MFYVYQFFSNESVQFDLWSIDIQNIVAKFLICMLNKYMVKSEACCFVVKTHVSYIKSPKVTSFVVHVCRWRLSCERETEIESETDIWARYWSRCRCDRFAYHQAPGCVKWISLRVNDSDSFISWHECNAFAAYGAARLNLLWFQA